MNRKEFVRSLMALGIGAPFMASLLSSCGKDELARIFDVKYNGKVIIIGAGPAGLIAGHLLKQHGIDFQILEAAPVFGGRVKKLEGFADFPIDLGAEWIHTHPRVLARLLNDDEVNASVETITYNPQTIKVWKNGKLRDRNFVSSLYTEYKFKNTTWFDFFADHIEPGIRDNILYNCPIKQVEHSGEEVVLTAENGQSYTAPRVVVTVPLNIIKQGVLTFSPALPTNKQEALEKVKMPPGIKIFAEFSKRFYPDITIDGNLMSLLNSDPKLWYDAAFRKDSNRHILGLFFVSPDAEQYTGLADDNARFELFIKELDEAFDGLASKYYVKHVIQNWEAEPFIRGSYAHYDNYWDGTLETLAAAINNKVYFAGSAYDSKNTSTVHGAGENAFNTIKQLLETPA